jgi:hypothetical protein
MSDPKLYAVLTGDVVGSSKLDADQHHQLATVLKSSFQVVKQMLPEAVTVPFEIYRGDSFQGLLSQPETALRAVIAIRAHIRCSLNIKKRKDALDARVAVGIGTVDFLPAHRVTEGDGEAFRRSGPVLDKMSGDQRMLIRTPWPHIDQEFDVECALLDASVRRWSAEQADVILRFLRGMNQEEIASALGVSQPAIQQRLKTAGRWAMEDFLRRFENVIGSKQDALPLT